MKGVGTLLGASIALCCALAGSAGRADAPVEWRSHVSQRLLSFYDGTPSRPAAAQLRVDRQGRVQIDVRYACPGPTSRASVEAAGLSVATALETSPLCVLEGWASPAALPAIAALSGVSRVSVPDYVVRRHLRAATGLLAGRRIERALPRIHAQGGSGAGIDGNGVTIVHADTFVSQTGTRGTGVMVGVQSTGVASISVIQGRGELPSVQVLVPSGGGNSADDEGTALLEEIHAVAPGAGLAFCGPDTFVQYVDCLSRLINAGANVLLDDMIFTTLDPMSSDSTYTQSIEQVLSQHAGVLVLTAAGNYNGSYWEGQFAPVSLASQGLAAMKCPGAVAQTDQYVAEFSGSASEVLTVDQPDSFEVMLTWADPYGQNASNFDLYWKSASDPSADGCLQGGASDSTQILTTLSLNGGSYKLYVATPDASLAGKFIKLWVGGDGLTALSDSSAGSIVTPQAYAHGVISVGAVDGADGIGNAIESFSSVGPISVAFPTPAKLQAPVLVAPDGIMVDAKGTYFEPFLFPDGNFYGTSAAVPNAGAVAALLRGAFPQLTPGALAGALQSGAAPLGAPVPDGTYGYGRVDALGALATLPGPTITALSVTQVTLGGGTSSPAYAFTVSGTGKLHFAVQSTNAQLVPAAVVPAGSPGVTVSPSACGATVLQCTLTINAGTGSTGTTTLTVQAVDGANRTASTHLTVDVNTPGASPGAPPPPAASAKGASSSGGGALDWGVLALLASIGVRRARRALLSPLR